MPTNLYPVAGCRFYIGAAMDLPDDDVTEASFSAVSWTEVKGYETMGDAGDAAEAINTNLINRRRTVTQKGTRKAPTRSDNFAVITSDAGQLALIAAERTDYNYPFRVDLNDVPIPRSAAVTISNASPGVVTMTGHGLAANTPIRLSTTGGLPTGLSPATTYYVKTVLDADTFTLSATPGGTVINTSSAGSGVHTLTTEPVPSKRLFMGLVTGAVEGNGGANNVRMLNASIEPNTNYVRVAPLG